MRNRSTAPMSSFGRRVRFPFRLKIAILTASFAALPLVAVGWLLIDVNAREIETSSQALQIVLTEQVAEQIDGELEAAQRALSAIANALTDESLSEDARVSLALRLLDAQPGLDLVVLYDARGELIDRMRDPRANDVATPERLLDPLRMAASSRGVAIGRPERSGTDAVRVLLVVPLTANGAVTGYAAAPFSLASVQRTIERLSRAHLASDEGALVIVDEQRRFLAHPDAERVLLPASDVALEPNAAELARAPISAEVEGRDGRTQIVTSVGLSRVPWAVVAQIPKDVAYASLDQMRLIVLATIAIALLHATLAAFFLAQRIAAPIAKLVAFTRELAARNFDRRVAISTRDELSVLGDALSDAAAELERSEARMQEEMAIRADLRRYLPGELVDAVIRREQSMELGGRRVDVSVLFADVVAFTPLSDRLPPEQVVALLNELFTLLTEAVFRHGGTVDKLIGDCVMALFGAPSPAEDHARRALLTAQDMLRFVESANDGWKERFGVEVQLAIGINSGEAVVGNVGSETRMEYTAIGDVVNVAARLETIARPQQILVSRATARAVGDAFELLPIGSREVPGRTEPVELFEVSW